MAGQNSKPLLGLFASLLFASSIVALGLSDVHRKVNGQSEVQNKAFHSSLLKQLADSRSNSTSPSFQTSTLDLAVADPSTTFATNATGSLQIYTSDSLPTNPAPSEECATALTATIPCNSTIPLMAYALFIFV